MLVSRTVTRNVAVTIFVSTVQCSSYINMLENVTALQGSHFILLLEFCAVQVKGEIQTGAVEDHSESVQQSYHWHKMSLTACHHSVFLVRQKSNK